MTIHGCSEPVTTTTVFVCEMNPVTLAVTHGRRKIPAGSSNTIDPPRVKQGLSRQSRHLVE